MSLGNSCIVRREFASDSMAIWFCDRSGQDMAVAKPLKLEFKKRGPGGFFELPEPTLILPGPSMKAFYESLGHELELNGERYLEARSTIRAQDANLEDLRKCIDKAFSLLLLRGDNLK